MTELIVFWFFVLLVNGLFSLLVAYAAKQKGRNAVAFFWLAFFASFVVGMLVVIAVPKLEIPDEGLKESRTGKVVLTKAGQRVKCPFCAEWVSGEARVCKHCGRDIETELRSAIDAEENVEAKAQKAQEKESEALRARQLAAEAERAEKAKEFLKSKQFKGIVAVAVVVLLGLGATLVARYFIWESFQAEIIQKTSIRGTEQHIRTTGEKLAQECGLQRSDWVFDGYLSDGEFGDPWEAWWIEVRLSGLSSEQIDCMTVGLVGVPYSYWNFWPRPEQVDLPNDYFLDKSSASGNPYFGWSTLGN
jgi:hypothetical protein